MQIINSKLYRKLIFSRGGNYAGINTSTFRDFLLKTELLRAAVDCGFEHPSEGKSALLI